MKMCDTLQKKTGSRNPQTGIRNPKQGQCILSPHNGKVPGPFWGGGGNPVRPVAGVGRYPSEDRVLPPPPDMLHRGRYASFGHAGGLSCLKKGSPELMTRYINYCSAGDIAEETKLHFRLWLRVGHISMR